MAKRANQKSADTEGVGDAVNTAEAPITAPGDTVQEQPGGGADGASGAPAGSIFQGQLPEASSSLSPVSPAPSSAQLDGVTMISVGQEVGNTDAKDPSTATAPETPASGDGGHPEDGDREALEAAVAAITGDLHPIIPQGMTVEFLPSGYQVHVTGPKKGRRRAGRNFGREPVSIPIEELTHEDLAALQSDPALTVEIVQITIPGREVGGQSGEMGTTR